MIPTGISVGDRRVLPKRSERTTREEPIRQELTVRKKVFPPESFLAMCGTTRPTKPKRPAKETTLPAAADAVIRQMSLNPFTLTPRERARESPRHRVSTFEDKISIIATEVKMISAGVLSCSGVMPERPPTEKYR